MSTVRVRAENDDVFDIESTWLPLLYQKERMLLPIGSKQAMDDLVLYVRQSDKILRLPRQPKKDEEGRIVRSPIDVAALDALATGVHANRGITAENQMEAFTRDFVEKRDLTSLVQIAQAAAALGMWELAGACVDRMVNEGLQVEGAHELLEGVQ